MIEKIYNAVKIILISFVIVLTIIIISYESNVEIGLNEYDSKFFIGIFNNYNILKKFIFNKSDNSIISQKVNDYFEYTTSYILDIYSNFTKFLDSEQLKEEIFVFIVTKYPKKINDIIENFFKKTNKPDSIFLTDLDNNIIFSYNQSFDPYIAIKNTNNIFTYSNYLVFSKYYVDDTLDVKMKILGFFNLEKLIYKINEFDFPVFLYIDNRILKNSHIDKIKINLSTGNIEFNENKKNKINNKIIEIFPISINNEFICSIGAVYYSKDFHYKIISFLKIIFIIILIIIIFILDRILINKIKILDNKLKNYIEYRKIRREQSIKEKEKMVDKNLEWFEDYVKGTEKEDEK